MSLADIAAAIDAKTAPPRTETLGRIAELLERNGIDVDDIGRVQKVNLWQGFHKDADGEAQVVDLCGVSLAPAWADGPQWPVAQPAPLYRLPTTGKASRSTPNGFLTAVALPDMQAGYFRGPGGELEPLQDEDAISVALSIVKDARPDLVVLHGDNADFAEFGRYRLSPAFSQTTQATIDRLGLLCAQLRSVAPEARIVWLAGNHEERLPNMLLDNARAAFGLRKANTPESWPVLSVPYLCQFDHYGIEYLPGYPASHLWINDRLKVIHGELVKSGGSTATAYLSREKVSVIYGHTHRREYAARTRDDRDGPKEIMAASSGCLARRDGVVPSTKGGTDLDGRPIQRTEDWQQGVGVIRYEPGDGRFSYDNIAIHEGWALWQGKEYTAT